MGIRREIDSMVRCLCKKAQAPGFTPTPLYYSSMMPKGMRERVQKEWRPGGKSDTLTRLAQNSAVRSWLASSADFAPDIVDTFVGTPAGIANGIYSAAKGDGFFRGYDDSKNFVKDWYSDPMSEGIRFLGSPLKKIMDKSDKANWSNLRKQMDDKEYNDTVRDMNEGYGHMRTGAGIATGLIGIPALGTMGATPASAISRLFPAVEKSKWLRYVPTAADYSIFFGDPMVDSAKNHIKANKIGDEADGRLNNLSYETFSDFMRSANPEAIEYIREYRPDYARRFDEEMKANNGLRMGGK